MSGHGIDYNSLRVLRRVPVGEWPQEEESAELPEILKHPSAPSAAIRRLREQHQQGVERGRNRRREAS